MTLKHNTVANVVSMAYPESLNLVVLDNGQCHQAKSLMIPEKVVFIFLPPYSPELNPIERLWQNIKDESEDDAKGQCDISLSPPFL